MAFAPASLIVSQQLTSPIAGGYVQSKDCIKIISRKNKIMFSAQAIMYWSVTVSTITVFIHIAFSVAVLNDASSLKSDDSKSLQFVSPFFWMLGLYWVIHHSTLSKE